MNPQHLSDEAVAAFADGVLRGLARERATRHVDGCAECRRAVQVQREAAWALRAAPAPPPPSALLDKLRTVPQTTPIPTPTAVDSDGTPLLATFAPMAALVPSPRETKARHTRPLLAAAIAVVAAGSLAAGSVAGDEATGSSGTDQLHTARQVRSGTDSGTDPRPAIVNPVYFLHRDRP